ncbi:phage tail protein [Salmonella enterica subsp. enterica serovar Give]|nr:phage tail protein [Salmonella enterica subsp. enterica serovar Give]
MSQAVITKIFSEWKAQQAVDNKSIVLDEFVFAYIPDLDVNKPISNTETIPAADKIVHRQAVSKCGVVNDNSVVYSVTLGADVGDFDFNWIGLTNKATGTLAMIIHAPVQSKVKNASGQQGNVLVRSMLMEYSGAQAATEITTPAETWQIDFTARLAAMDERQRLENVDQYGPAAFFGEGYLVAKSGTKFLVTKGAGYVAGLRTSLAENQDITVSTKPIKVWLDVSWTGTLTSAWGVQQKITVADTLADYEQGGIRHFVFALASIDAAGVIKDLRPQGSLDEQKGNSDFLRKDKNLSDVEDKASARNSLGLKNAALREVGNRPGDVMEVGAGRLLAGTFVSAEDDAKSIGARAATGCQFMRAHLAPDAPDQFSFWQIITLTEVVSQTAVVDVLAISGNTVVFGHGTGAGITSWRHVAMLEGAAFTGDISAPNMRGSTAVSVGDGAGGMATGGADGAGFNGNNLNIKSWNGIGFQNSADLVIRAYISTKLGIIAASESVYAGGANLYKNGDVYGDKWSTGNGPNWLSLYIEQLDSQIRNDLTTWTSNNFPTKSDVSVDLSGKPGRQYIKAVGVYQNDKTKPFMLHDDNSGVFLATTDMLSGYVQSIRFGGVEQGNVWRAPGFADAVGYVITGIENGDLNDTPDRIQRRLLQIKVNGQWYTVGA